MSLTHHCRKRPVVEFRRTNTETRVVPTSVPYTVFYVLIEFLGVFKENQEGEGEVGGSRVLGTDSSLSGTNYGSCRSKGWSWLEW